MPYFDSWKQYFLEFQVRAIKQARKMIEQDPSQKSAKTLAQLVLALESDAEFKLGELYDLRHDDFQLAIEVLKDWRLDRYYEGKAKLFDVSVQVQEMGKT